MTSTMRRLHSLLFAFVCLPASVLASTPTTHEYTLDNGLKVIIREDHRAPVVVSQLWYKVGSSYETAGSTGLSHALEHMMFKGSDKAGPGEASLILRDIGASENAFTSDDYTAYYQILARDRLPIALELEADRLANLHLPAEEFTKELEVIKEERRLRTDDKPGSLAYERFSALAFLASGYRTPTIGWMKDLERMTIADLRAWHEQWYAPNNATLVIVGDVTPDYVKPLVERFFAGIPSRPLPAAKQPLELPAAGERRLTLQLKAQLPSLLMGFNVPSHATHANQREIYALRLAAAVLDGGASARFPRELERKQELVSGAGTYYDAFSRGDSLFVISATPNTQKNVSLEQTEAGIWQQLEALQKTPPSAQELSRVRAQVIAGLVYSRDEISNQANTLGRLVSVGLDWRMIDQELEALESITPQEVQQAASTWFNRDRLTVAYVYPEETHHE